MSGFRKTYDIDKNALTILSTDTDLADATPSDSDTESFDEISGFDLETTKGILRRRVDIPPFLEYIEPRRLLQPRAGLAEDKRYDVTSQDPNYYEEWCSSYMQFTDDNPCTCHAISTFSSTLCAAGFQFMSETEPFNLSPKGGAYFVTRGGKALCAFLIGGKWKPEDGIGAVASHIDALAVKLKPNSIKREVSGYGLLGVAPYSEALNLSWLDRDLGIAGSVLIGNENGRVHSKLVSSGRHAICRIPSLAPHFRRTSVLAYNKETNMVPVMSYSNKEESPTDEELSAPLFGKHSLSLLRYIAKLSKSQVKDLVQLDLELYDVQAASRGGLNDEFIFAPRIDDRLCSFSALHALIKVKKDANFEIWDGFTAVLLADNEEIGSATRVGAKGKLLNSIVERVLSERNLGSSNSLLTFANSVILSADVTHALNPNFVTDYLEGNFPLPNKGLTLKLDVNGHVMTDLTGVVLMDKIAAKNGLNLQRFHIRNDRPSGSTIGPMLAVDTGSRVIDVGLAQLSMYSIRACCGFKEPGIGVEAFASFFKDWRKELNEIDCN